MLVQLSKIFCLFYLVVLALYTNFPSTLYESIIFDAEGIISWKIKAEASGEN